MKMVRNESKRPQSGPEPERLKIDGDWKDAVKKAMANGKPPKEPAKKKTPRGKRGVSSNR
jgi:hypothetical protein